jgi:hypothetical protein
LPRPKGESNEAKDLLARQSEERLDLSVWANSDNVVAGPEQCRVRADTAPLTLN